MAFPPRLAGDGDTPEWAPPDYAEPVDDSKWEAPDYAKPVKEKKTESKSLLSRVKDFLTPADKLDVTKAIPAQLHQFAEEHPELINIARRFISGPSEEEVGGKKILGPGIMKIPGLEKATDYLAEKAIGSEGNARLAAGTAIKVVGSLLEGGFDPRTAGIKSIPAVDESRLPPIRQRKERLALPPGPRFIAGEGGVAEAGKMYNKDLNAPYGIQNPEGGTLTTGDVGEVNKIPPDLAAKYGLEPKPSGSVPEEQIPLSQTPKDNRGISTFVKDNPDAKMKDIERFIDSMKSAPPVSDKDLPLRSPNLDPNRFPVEGAATGGISKQRNVEDLKYDLAKNKFNMGKSIPEPTAEFLALGEDGKPLFNIKGGSTDRSTVSAETLEKMGIPIPDVPKDAVPMKGSEIRARLLSERKDEFKPDFKNPFEKPTDSEAELGTKLSPYGEGGLLPSESRPTELSLDQEWKPPDYAKPTEVVKKNEVKLNEPVKPIIDTKDVNKTPESLHPQLTALKNYGDGVLFADFDKSKPLTEDAVKDIFAKRGENVDVTQMYSTDKMPSRFRIDVKGNDPVHSAELADNIEKSVGGSFDDTSELSGGLGGITPPGGSREPTKGPNGRVLDKLYSALEDAKSSVVDQEAINRATRAKRFAAFSSVKEEGAEGAAKSLGKLRGEFEKVEPGETLGLKKQDTDQLFTAIKTANITPAEKARGYTALFKLLNGESVPVRSELGVLDSVFANGFGEKITELHGGIGGVGIKLTKAANTMKSMQNAMSLAAPLRHGIGLAYKKEFYPALVDMFKFFKNKEFYDASMQAIKERPNYLLGRESGLYLAEPGSFHNAEEEFLNSYVGNLPKFTGIPQVVGASQRGYVGFLNKLRSDVFDSMLETAESLGNPAYTTKVKDGVEIKVPTKTAKDISNFINNATGRGDLGRLNKMTSELNLVLWSPRMIASRVNMFANPKLYMNLPKGMRLEGLKSLLGIAALGTTIDTLAAYGGAKVSTNILSTDFMKARTGTKLIDPWGGLQQYVVGAARFLAGRTDSTQPTSRLDIAGKFLANKESPVVSLAHTMLTAKKFEKADPNNPLAAGSFTNQYGQKTSVPREILQRFTPIFVQDVDDLIQLDPKWADNIGLTAAMTGASLTGMAQEYPERKGKLGFKSLKQNKLR